MFKKVIFCVCDINNSNKAKVMLDSFNKYNDDFYSIIFTYGDFNVGSYKSVNFYEKVSCFNMDVFEKCETYRFIAARELLKQFETVIYCDCDCMFFDKLPEFSGEIAMCEHFSDWSKCKNLNHFFNYGGLINIGFMVFNKTSEFVMNCICDMCLSKEAIIYEDKRNKKTIRLQPFITLLSHISNNFEFIKNYGINVAYWNLKSENLSDEREIIKVDNKYFVNDICNPLIMFHFSGCNGDYFTRFNGKKPYEYYGKYIREITEKWRELCR